MTLVQALAVLGVDPRESDASESVDEATRAQRRTEILDDVCRLNRLHPFQLSELPPERIRDLLRCRGHTVVDVKMLAGWVKDYAAGKVGYFLTTSQSANPRAPLGSGFPSFASNRMGVR